MMRTFDESACLYRMKKVLPIKGRKHFAVTNWKKEDIVLQRAAG